MSFETNMTICVLVAEDNPLAMLTCRVCLEDMDCFVSEASTCREAGELWKAGKFDLVIMDYRLPDGLGTEVIEMLRADGHDEPAICLTAEAESVPEDLRAKLGIRAVLNKPLDLAALKNEVEKARNESGNSAPGRAVSIGGKTAWRNIGRFKVFKYPGTPGKDSMDEIENAGESVNWVALDMKDIKTLDERSISVLLDIAARYSEHGGRFCLAGVSESLLRQLSVLRVDKKLDIVRDIAALEPLGRRLFSGLERNAVLESVVKGHDNG